MHPNAADIECHLFRTDLAVEGVMDPVRSQPGAIEARLGLWDAVSLIVGIIIGVGIFETPPDIFAKAPGPWAALGVWLLGGVLALLGALCFAELAAAYPRSGGEYVYLTRAYGPLTGFLFGWAQLTVIRPGSIGALAFVFAHHAGMLWSLAPGAQLVLACGAIMLLTVLNVLGVTLGKHTQNLLTVLKVVGLAALILVGLALGNPRAPGAPASWSGQAGWFAGAMIFVMWTYAGWHEAAYIAAEVKNGRRNIPLALILGTAAVTAIYLLVNLAFWLGLGYEGAKSNTVAADLVGLLFPRFGPQVMNILVMVSALGAINGMIFTTARIFTEFGSDHRLFLSLSHWSRRLRTPARALAVESLLSILMVLAVGLWWQSKQSLDTMIEMTAAVFWLFFLLTGVSLFVLRTKDTETPRPFRVPGYPLVPLLFCGWCAYMVLASLWNDPKLSLVGIALLAAGIPLYFLPHKLAPRGKAAFLPLSLRQEVIQEVCSNR